MLVQHSKPKVQCSGCGEWYIRIQSHRPHCKSIPLETLEERAIIEREKFSDTEKTAIKLGQIQCCKCGKWYKRIRAHLPYCKVKSIDLNYGLPVKTGTEWKEEHETESLPGHGCSTWSASSFLLSIHVRFPDHNVFQTKNCVITSNSNSETRYEPQVGIDRLQAKDGKYQLYLCFLNIRSVTKNINDIHNLIKREGFDIFGLSETRLDESIPSSGISLPGYQILRKDRNRRGGGVAIFVSDSCHVKRVTDFEVAKLEIICIEVEYQGEKILIWNCYRPPSSLSTSFALELKKCIKTAIGCFPEHSMIVMGDLNARNQKWWPQDLTNMDGEILDKTFSEISWRQLINKPTRFGRHCESCIDLMFTNNSSVFTASGVLDCKINSDHLPIFGKVNFSLKHAEDNCKSSLGESLFTSGEDEGKVGLNLSNAIRSDNLTQCSGCGKWYKRLKTHQPHCKGPTVAPVSAAQVAKEREQCQFCAKWFIRLKTHLHYCKSKPVS